MLLSLKSRLLIAIAFGLIAVYLAHDLGGLDGFDHLLGAWFHPVVFGACGAVTLQRALALPCGERAPWLVLGSGLVLYATGSVYFNLVVSQDPEPTFPSLADGLWLTLYPLTFTTIDLIVRRRFAHVSATVWLDGVIGGAAVAAVAAALLFQPLFDVTVSHGVESIVRLAYPLGDLLVLGFVVVLWSLSNRRLDGCVALLGFGFALLAVGDSGYVVQAARGEWAPGGPLDVPYALGTMLLAAAAWTAPRGLDSAERTATPAMVPVAHALVAVALTAYAVVSELNPLAVALVLVTLFAVVVRFAVTLLWLTRQRAALAAQAFTDPLTGLANHRAFHERLAEELDRACRHVSDVSVVALDLDHFKAVNDTYGHAQGDAALQAVARVLQTHARTYDVVGRLGGEEFALILPDVDGERARAIAERCRLAITELTIDGMPMSCSAGIASYPADGPDAQRLMELADGALYWAKRSGRGQVRCYDAREVVLLSAGEQHEEVRGLLERPGALTPVFQPIVELATGSIGGYEALTRFLDTEPVRTHDVWFAQARRCGLGAALEARAVQLALEVPGRPPGTFLSLNVSPAALMSCELDAVLPDDLTDIVIELTEHDLFSSGSELDARLAGLRGRGARIAVDDVGAGYSGLHQMVRIKPDILKLDRSLISGIHMDSSKIALLEAMASFAASTGAALCGEGIEEIEELRVLGRFDVAYGQGYALGRPAPAWPRLDERVAAEATSEARWGLRLARLEGSPEILTIGDVTEALARVHTLDGLNRAMEMIERLLHADDVAVSRVCPEERCVQTLSQHDWGPTNARYYFADYPTTETVVRTQVLGQVVDGDPAADRAELDLIRSEGYGTVLLAPIVFRGETLGLLEIYRRTRRPWANAEIDETRLLAHHLGALLCVADLAPPQPLPAPWRAADPVSVR
jgi:diguanylate cyclase (GGDEF)-like protein